MAVKPPIWPRISRTTAAAPTTPKGVLTEANPSIGPGDSAKEIAEATMAVPAIHMRGRQRDEGRLPVGKSSMRNTKDDTAEICTTVESHAATAPRGNFSERSATVAYCPENSCTPAPTLRMRKIHPMTFPGRLETISAPKIANVTPIKVSESQNP